jgi:multicomponent Na+:H+ antiporter subunit E
MMGPLIVILWLTLVWMALWESFTLANLLGGLVIAVLVVLLVPLRSKVPRVGFRPLRAIKLLLYFIWKLLVASLIVSWEVVTPTDRTSPAVVSVPLDTPYPGIVTAVANMVSLTPGTLTVDVDRHHATLFIHVLHFKSAGATSGDVRTLERLTVEAFPLRQVGQVGA